MPKGCGLNGLRNVTQTQKLNERIKIGNLFSSKLITTQASYLISLNQS